MSNPLVTSALPTSTDSASRANACLDADIWFCGDTHGKFAHLRRAMENHCPRAVIFLGDVQPLARLAAARGTPDDVTVLVVDVEEE